jgi:NADH-quinone oxidoreductase subunit L
MLAPLVILAVLSIVGGWVGIHHRFDNFLAPVFESSTVAATTFEGGAATGVRQETPGLETTLMFVSVAAGVLGFLLAFLLYYRKPELPARIAASAHGLYSAILHKYWIDEMYASLLVKPIMVISSVVLWRGIDRGVIDASLDGTADGTRDLSDDVRHMQSGNVRSYAGWVALGATAVIAYMIWVGLRTP